MKKQHQQRQSFNLLTNNLIQKDDFERNVHVFTMRNESRRTLIASCKDSAHDKQRN